MKHQINTLVAVATLFPYEVAVSASPGSVRWGGDLVELNNCKNMVMAKCGVPLQNN